LEAHQPDGAVVCKFCGSKFAEDDRLVCPHCQVLNRLEADFCAKCGEKLKRGCPACGAENWAGAEFCISCGRDLDLLTYMAQRQTHGFQTLLEEQRQMARTLKDKEDADSQKRLAQMWDVERRRQEFLAQQSAEQRQQQSRLLVSLSVVVVLFVGLIIVALVYFALTR
jgi:ribosomal protein L40E